MPVTKHREGPRRFQLEEKVLEDCTRAGGDRGGERDKGRRGQRSQNQPRGYLGNPFARPIFGRADTPKLCARLRGWGGLAASMTWSSEASINQTRGSSQAVETRQRLPRRKSVSLRPTQLHPLLNSVSLMALNQAKKLYRWISPTESQAVTQLQEPAVAFRTRRAGCLPSQPGSKGQQPSKLNLQPPSSGWEELQVCFSCKLYLIIGRLMTQCDYPTQGWTIN